MYLKCPSRYNNASIYYEGIIYPNLLRTLKIIPGVLQFLLSRVTFFSKYGNDYICVGPSPSLVTSECVNQVRMAWKRSNERISKVGTQWATSCCYATQGQVAAWRRMTFIIKLFQVPGNLRSMFRPTTDVHYYRTRSASNQQYWVE